MTGATNDPRCPKCGGPIGQTATYCMHCSADLTQELNAADADNDGVWDQTDDRPETGVGRTIRDAIGEALTTADEDSGHLLAPDGLVDNTLTVVVGIVGGLVVGTVGILVLLFVTGSGWAVVVGFVAWLGATAYLVRRRTVQDAIAKTGYALALVLLFVPIIALSPAAAIDGGIEERGSLFLVLLLFVAVPAGIAAAIGWVASQFTPENASDNDG